jgi:hypothetical protein
MNESNVKDAVKRILKERGAWWFMPVSTGYGRHGIPDFIVCYKGYFITIETKYGGNKPTAHQARELDGIRLAGGIALIINEKNIDVLKSVFDWIDIRRGATCARQILTH